MNVLPAQPIGIQSTAGAVPIRNEKGKRNSYNSFIFQLHVAHEFLRKKTLNICPLLLLFRG